ncbi:hypothetical protein [Mycolicibacterium thermoresistibile]|uniref:Uncharacterized protein n=1 Tax=Mycolicibacterium thermoresistibile (strain ATCC 19527 / DSM 44167 / CIP 105390 / JCM 6362 / NCTC 10409 / 316) TaxID=1078020 RepID=G7CBR7_MYCT3|nr:hypothetical protein [Mycolicibacterium thermoresistibile]EHI14571.1 hypothetical protein KEK_02055 [Mycolicibacterium thermoresistibile ATCC 19527]
MAEAAPVAGDAAAAGCRGCPAATRRGGGRGGAPRPGSRTRTGSRARPAAEPEPEAAPAPVPEPASAAAGEAAADAPEAAAIEHAAAPGAPGPAAEAASSAASAASAAAPGFGSLAGLPGTLPAGIPIPTDLVCVGTAWSAERGETKPELAQADRADASARDESAGD